VADGILEHANQRLVHANHVVARPASGDAAEGEVVRRGLHAWIRVDDLWPRAIRADAQITVVVY
jgi:hypothetical protein